MGLIYADIELVNADDPELAKKSILGDDEIKRLTVKMLVDTGAYNRCINETIQQQLDLPFVEKRKGVSANGHIEEYDVVGPVQVLFKNRKTVCYSLVLHGDNEPLLGSIPLEDRPARLPSKRLIK